jgi:translocator protein
MMPTTPFYQGLFGGILLCVVMGVAGGLLTKLSPWYFALRQPSWKPPDWAFGPIWTVVFICLSLATAYAWEAADATQRSLMLAALAINAVLNIAWSGIFFVMKNPSLAFAELILFWLSIVALIWIFDGVSRTSALLLLPYICWVTTAGVLNYSIIGLNRTSA